VWVLPGPVPKPMKAGFYPTHYGYFLRVPIGSGSNCHLYQLAYGQNTFAFKKNELNTCDLFYQPLHDFIYSLKVVFFLHKFEFKFRQQITWIAQYKYVTNYVQKMC